MTTFCIGKILTNEHKYIYIKLYELYENKLWLLYVCDNNDNQLHIQNNMKIYDENHNELKKNILLNTYLLKMHKEYIIEYNDSEVIRIS